MANVPSVFYVDPDVYLNKQIAANLCKTSYPFWRIDHIFSNVSGFTPYSRLKRTDLASTAFFPLPMPSVY
jgi:hypothetical protein